MAEQRILDGLYKQFLAGKARTPIRAGRIVIDEELHPGAFPFQRDLTRWAIQKGRCGIFASTGLGKTLMQLMWAQASGERVLILAPLGVVNQTVREGERWGIKVIPSRAAPMPPRGITITNYEMLEHFPGDYDAVVLDESSILKSFNGKTRTRLIARFMDTPRRLCCTATPAPNDIAEIANHSEFLGIMTRADMLATFFVHDDDGWRLKGHAREPFYKWLASWGLTLSHPSDLGYEADGFDLPLLTVTADAVEGDFAPEGQLFHTGLSGITGRAKLRAASADQRVNATLEMLTGEKWVVWCGRNDEQDAIAKALGSECVSIYGSLSASEKVEREEHWRLGRIPVLISKPSVFGWGMNWQHCHHVAFCGLSDSWEQYYQAIRRCWRFGQTEPVDVHVVLSEPEMPIFTNVLRKEKEALGMQAELIEHMAEFERSELGRPGGRLAYAPTEPMRLPAWLS